MQHPESCANTASANTTTANATATATATSNAASNATTNASTTAPNTTTTANATGGENLESLLHAHQKGRHLLQDIAPDKFRAFQEEKNKTGGLVGIAEGLETGALRTEARADHSRVNLLVNPKADLYYKLFSRKGVWGVGAIFGGKHVQQGS